MLRSIGSTRSSRSRALRTTLAIVGAACAASCGGRAVPPAEDGGSPSDDARVIPQDSPREAEVSREPEASLTDTFTPIDRAEPLDRAADMATQGDGRAVDASFADISNDAGSSIACVPIGGYTPPPGFPADGSGYQITAENYVTGTTINALVDPGVIAMADVTGDGRTDVVGVNWSNGVWIWAQKPGGSFREIGPLDVGLDRLSLSGPSLLDVDQDGVTDILIGNDQGLQIIRSLGDGKFATDAVLVPGPRPERFAIVDENADGQLDLVAMGRGEMTDGGGWRIPILIYRANAQRWLDKPEVSFLSDVPPHASVFRMRVGDVTGDGVSDFVATVNNEVVVYGGRGAGMGFRETGVHYPLSAADSSPNESGLDIGDVDHDGKNDVVVSEDTHVRVDNIWALLQDANGRLRPPVSLYAYGPDGAATSHGGEVIITDVNLDGMTDVVNLDRSGLTTFVFLSDKTGSRTTRSAMFPNFSSAGDYALVVGDVNCDGCLDVVSAQMSSLTIFFGKGCRGK